MIIVGEAGIRMVPPRPAPVKSEPGFGTLEEFLAGHPATPSTGHRRPQVPLTPTAALAAAAYRDAEPYSTFTGMF